MGTIKSKEGNWGLDLGSFLAESGWAKSTFGLTPRSPCSCMISKMSILLTLLESDTSFTTTTPPTYLALRRNTTLRSVEIVPIKIKPTKTCRVLVSQSEVQ